MLSRWVLGYVIKAGAGSLQEVMRCVLLCMLKAVEDGLCLLEVSEVLEVSIAMRRGLFCMARGRGG